MTCLLFLGIILQEGYHTSFYFPQDIRDLAFWKSYFFTANSPASLCHELPSFLYDNLGRITESDKSPNTDQ
jgi:hypothetical protein